MTKHYLSPLFAPRSVAVFGASERPESVGMQVFKSLSEGGFVGNFYPINPKRDQVQGYQAYASLDQIGEPIDLAVIATPAPSIPRIMEECGEYGIKAAAVLSAGFREIGEDGKRLEDAVLAAAQRYGIRFIGPNCLGIMRPSLGLNATFGKGGARAGQLGLVSQSGALCTAILDWAEPNGVGFSSVISTGIGADLGFGEILDFMVSDPQTASILMYIEGVQTARRFVSALRAASRVKPVIVTKVGRHAEGSQAAKSHTGALVGADDVFDAALRRAGAVRVLTTTDLFNAAKTLASNVRTYGDRLAIITNGGGPGVLATDLAGDRNLPLAQLTKETNHKLNEVLPSVWSHGNPVDIIGDAPPQRYRDAVEIVAADPGVDALLVILTPQAMTDPTAVAQALVASKDQVRKPLLTCWMGETQVAEGRRILSDAGILTYEAPEAAIDAFSYLAQHYRSHQQLREAPAATTDRRRPDIQGARLILETALHEDRGVLSEMESKAVLRGFDIPIAQTVLARTPNEALVIAEQMGFPVAMKIQSPDITHKSDANGVRLNIRNAYAVRSTFNEIMAAAKVYNPRAEIEGVAVQPMADMAHARELMVGVIDDPVFGPVISVGGGGTAVEIYRDRAVALPPLNRALARDLVAGTKIYRGLRAFRNMPPADLEALYDVLMAVSEMVCELPRIKEMDINPLLVGEHGVLAVDARIVPQSVDSSAAPYSHMAIHPYPNFLIQDWQMADGTDITIRPLRPEDAELANQFVRNLSDESKYFRFRQIVDELSPEMLTRLTQIDYDREMGLLAIRQKGADIEQLGVARYEVNPDGESADLGIAIADRWQRRGIGRKLLSTLMAIARDRGLKVIRTEVLSDNHAMLGLARELGFSISTSSDSHDIKVLERKL